MRRVTILLLSVLAACGGDSAPPPAPTTPPSIPKAPVLPAIVKRVSIAATTSSWRVNEKPFDVVADLSARLREAGIERTDGAADGSLTVEYAETKGRDYVDTFQRPAGTGTDIKLSLTVHAEGRDDASLVLEAGTGFAAEGGLYEAALASLKRRDAYQLAGSFVAGALGVPEALPRLVPVLYDLDARTPVAQLFASASFRPEKTADRAQLLLASHDAEACVALGRDAVEPLLNELKRGWVPEYEVQLAQALGKIGDPRPARYLLDTAKEKAPFAYGDAAVIAALIEAVGATGDRSMLPELSALAGNDEKRVAAAAVAAKAAIEARP